MSTNFLIEAKKRKQRNCMGQHLYRDKATIVLFASEGEFAIKLKSKVRDIDLQEIARLHTY